MKLLLMALSALYLIGCGSMSGDDLVEDIKSYTITHATDNEEDVLIYLQYPEDKNKIYYKVQPGECLSITEEQFSSLVVKVGENWSTGRKTLCGDSDDNKCQPNNYNIVDTGDFLNDIYELQAIEEVVVADASEGEETADASDSTEVAADATGEDTTAEVVVADASSEETVECFDIAEWMVEKNPKLVAQTEEEAQTDVQTEPATEDVATTTETDAPADAS